MKIANCTETSYLGVSYCNENFIDAKEFAAKSRSVSVISFRSLSMNNLSSDISSRFCRLKLMRVFSGKKS